MNKLDIKWIRRFFNVVKEVASWSSDPSTKVGAVIVSNKRIIGTGYNGPSPGADDDWVYQTRDRKLMYTHHAEHNAIEFSDKKRLNGSAIFISHPPCEICTTKILDSGVKAVYYLVADDEFEKRWNPSVNIELLQTNNINCYPYKESEL